MAVLRFVGSLVAGVMIGLVAMFALATLSMSAIYLIGYRGPDLTLLPSFLCGAAIGAYSSRIILQRISSSPDPCGDLAAPQGQNPQRENG